MNYMLISLGNLSKPFFWFGIYIFTKTKEQKQSPSQKSYSRVTLQKSVNTKSMIMGNSPMKISKHIKRKKIKIIRGK